MEKGGIGFWGLLTLVLITLKLVGVIDWSWWWVLSPLLLGVGLLIVVLTIVGILFITGAPYYKR